MYVWPLERREELRLKCFLLMEEPSTYEVVEIICNLKDALDSIELLQDALDLKEL